ncbi:MAG: hypothetical protein OFPI_06920 [Osedax symbiont Rs2]|nr:MAG: hypothetical protein OFPI_06920 [Osedax symbiont Rs2]
MSHKQNIQTHTFSRAGQLLARSKNALIATTLLSLSSTIVSAHSKDTTTLHEWQPDSSVLTQLINAIITPVSASALISIQGNYRVIASDALPDHETGAFPNRNNPNSIKSKNLNYKVPAKPQLSGKTTQLGMSPFGVALNGVPFDPNAAEFWQNNRRSGWQYEALGGGVNLGLDKSSAHVQPDGTYHYHGIPYLLLVDRSTQQLLGYAADGFPIYSPWGYSNALDSSSPVVELKSSYSIKSGSRPSGPKGQYDGTFVEDYQYQPGLGQLDSCNGRSGVTAEYPQGTYYYVISGQFPFIPRCFKGTADSSFERKRGPNNGTQQRAGQGNRQAPGQGNRTPPKQAIAACKGKSEGQTVSFNVNNRRLSGTCRSRNGQLFAVPQR